MGNPVFTKVGAVAFNHRAKSKQARASPFVAFLVCNFQASPQGRIAYSVQAEYDFQKLQHLNYDPEAFPPAKFVGVLLYSDGTFYHYWFPLLSALDVTSLDFDYSLYRFKEHFV